MKILIILLLLVIVSPASARMPLTDQLIMEDNIANQLRFQNDLGRMEQRFDMDRLEREIESLKRDRRAMTVEEYLLILQFLQDQKREGSK